MIGFLMFIVSSVLLRRSAGLFFPIGSARTSTVMIAPQMGRMRADRRRLREIEGFRLLSVANGIQTSDFRK